MKLPIIAIMLAALVLPASALADKPAPPVQPFTLVYESNVLMQYGCLREDSFHWREWRGQFSGTFQAFDRFCSYETDGQYGGNSGIEVEMYTPGRLDSLTIHYDGSLSPLIPVQPEYTQQAVWVGSTLVGKGAQAVTWNRYQACFNAGTSYYAGLFAGMLVAPVEVTLQGDFPDAEFWVRAGASFIYADDATLNTYCPPGQRR